VGVLAPRVGQVAVVAAVRGERPVEQAQRAGRLERQLATAGRRLGAASASSAGVRRRTSAGTASTTSSCAPPMRSSSAVSQTSAPGGEGEPVR
jgi:hypothetical protein